MGVYKLFKSYYKVLTLEFLSYGRHCFFIFINLFLFLKLIFTVSTRISSEKCQTNKDCRIHCNEGFPICLEGVCTCSDKLPQFDSTDNDAAVFDAEEKEKGLPNPTGL